MNKDYQQVWSNCLRIIKDNVPAISFRTWFEPIIPIKVEKNVLTIQVPSPFFYEYLEEQYIDILRKTLRTELGTDAKLEYSVIMENNVYSNATPYTVKLPTNDRKELSNKPLPLPLDDQKTIKNPFIIPGIQKLHVDPQLNSSNNFNNFIEGECNRLARSAGYAVANNPGKTAFNPLFLFGASGLGKSHLAQAIGIEVKERYPDKVVLYVNGNKFHTQFVEAILNNNRNDFVHFYQMIDVLIIDDVHEFAGKEKTQDIFFHIFNHLHQNSKQLILTSDKSPVDLQGMEQRLLSRFKWGLSADLQIPDYETRIAILKKKVYNDGIVLPDEVVEYIASHISTNIRELEGALISLLAQSTLNKKEITLDLARKMIDRLVKNTKRELSIDYIQKVVCDFFNMPHDVINSKTRKREIVQARQIAMFFAKNLTKSSLATIGSQIGGKDHATVLHACKTVNNLMDTDKRFRGFIEDIEKKLKI
ncbi:MAG TPA: chromosomal replication initiator protein DnaA [Marinilabiliales bacterium]|jgi:chromosomal replication initiator protein|nr:MAG: chromosomal replication initiation protein DnaA [Bacteroidetes bacterium GWA2_40_14]OFX60907.1 MAG: chromosomal replication initiation protein DnaA [Bacteroidetes bacterium GWC2_40_13]OFX71562.1 MAG: chromosomal replication initiation protein DnaA [Bacteroidetes bacterium GWD2_40_43]OFX95596.1 MAG: chromosomal replication initiation protein DnaA [Bacteroidetes bacterium GWE2_40_63]OFZ24883.1 MAG: chromosomal replication initiation protein DnaA [Bacteroidetes bacterium RIFOXYC2_FULL_40_1